MLKKMRKKFIIASMGAFGIVITLLAALIIIVNYSVTVSRENNILHGIIEYEQMKLTHSETDMPMISDMPWSDGPEADFTTRFFVVSCDDAGKETVLSQDHISSMDNSDIQNYVDQVTKFHSNSGYIHEYRYMKLHDETGYFVAFLNVSRDIHFLKTLAIVSVAAVTVSMLLVLLLVFLFSKKAMIPFEKNIAKQKRFITDASHELKTPLTSIMTSADILTMDYGDNEWMSNIRSQADRMTSLVKEMVELARLDEVEPHLNKTDFDLSSLFTETAKSFAPDAKALGKTFGYDADSSIRFHGDKESIHHLISILLDNALRYSDAVGNIYLTLHKKHNHIILQVTNTCDYINADELDRIFDRFYRMDESRTTQTGGSGIGLSIAQAVTEAHGGKIQANSKNGHDVTFTVTF